jgi:hypothetical protein
MVLVYLHWLNHCQQKGKHSWPNPTESSGRESQASRREPKQPICRRDRTVGGVVQRRDRRIVKVEKVDKTGKRQNSRRRCAKLAGQDEVEEIGRP